MGVLSVFNDHTLLKARPYLLPSKMPETRDVYHGIPK
jgi:hypothetical protein